MTEKYLLYNHIVGLFHHLSQDLARCEYELSQKKGDLEWMARKEKIIHDKGILEKMFHSIAAELNQHIEDLSGERFKFIIDHKSENKVSK